VPVPSGLLGFQAQTLEIFGSFADQWVSLT
jgi:hypothetical protein